MKKEHRHTTAFCPMHNVYVKIERAIEDDKTGEWIYICSSNYATNEEDRFTDYPFYQDELTGFVI